MATWIDFARQRPDLAEAGAALLYQHGVGLAFLATVTDNQRPRLHPVCPLISDEGLFAFIIPSPKQHDLHRDGTFAMHSFPCATNEDAFNLTGQAHRVTDPHLREHLAKQFVTERAEFAVATPDDDQALFRFNIDSCLLTRTSGHGDAAPNHTVWHA